MTISLADATDRLKLDHELLLAQVTGRTEAELRARRLVAVWTVPGQPAFWHPAIHLQQLPARGTATAEGAARQ